MNADLQYTFEGFQAEVRGLFPDIPFDFSKVPGFSSGRAHQATWQDMVITRRPDSSMFAPWRVSVEGQVPGFGDTLVGAAADAAKSLFHGVARVKPLNLERFLPAVANDE